VRRAPLRRSTPLRSTTGPVREVPLRRTPLRPGPWSRPDGEATNRRRAPFGASQAQREKIVGSACVVCRQTKGLTPAHLAPRSQGGCDHPDCVVPLCWTHHRAYDTGRLELLPHLEPQWRAEIAHAVSHLGLIGAVRRLAPGRR
jgi:hypothetical protein